MMSISTALKETIKENLNGYGWIMIGDDIITSRFKVSPMSIRQYGSFRAVLNNRLDELEGVINIKWKSIDISRTTNLEETEDVIITITY